MVMVERIQGPILKVVDKDKKLFCVVDESRIANYAYAWDVAD